MELREQKGIIKIIMTAQGLYNYKKCENKVGRHTLPQNKKEKEKENRGDSGADWGGVFMQPMPCGRPEKRNEHER